MSRAIGSLRALKHDVRPPQRQRPALGFDSIQSMFGRYTIAKDQEALSGYFGAEFSETHQPIYNGSPGQCLPVILDVEPGRI